MSKPNLSTMNEQATTPAVDLSQLSFQRQAPAKSALQVPRRWLSRYVVPLGVVGAFLGLFGWAARDSFLPAQDVTITPVVVTRAEVQQEGTPLFQAAGWIEPQPSAVIASSLAAGVVEELMVVEGQIVEKDQPIAKLFDTDAKIAVQQAQANLRLANADVKNAEATSIAASAALANPNELQAALAEADSLLAETKLTLGNLPFSIEAAKTRRQLAADNLSNKQQAGDAVAGRVLREAAAELAATESALGELLARKPTLETQLDALARRQAALQQQLELMTEQKRAVSAAEAMLAVAQARREQAQLEVDTAQLSLERMIIRAPISGRILTVEARRGKRLAGMDPLSEQSSSAVATLYDPKSLQIRVDVRLEDVPQVQIGQPVAIETAALAAPITGEVLWLTTRADIQKNTLQVKVAIKDPPPVITPEMLGQVTFLAPPQPVESGTAEADPLRLLVPRALLVESESGSAVWVADMEHGIARRQTVELGRAGTDQLVEIAAGLDPTSKLIVAGREALEEGTRIRIAGDDRSLSSTFGVPPSASADSASAARTAKRGE